MSTSNLAKLFFFALKLVWYDETGRRWRRRENVRVCNFNRKIPRFSEWNPKSATLKHALAVAAVYHDSLRKAVAGDLQQKKSGRCSSFSRRRPLATFSTPRDLAQASASSLFCRSPGPGAPSLGASWIRIGGRRCLTERGGAVLRCCAVFR